MASSTYSFDIVSDFDRQELVNALDQTRRDVSSRYDLKDTKTTLDLGDEAITIETASEMTLDAVKDVLQQKAAKRDLSLKIFEYGSIESASGNRIRTEVKLKKGLSQELAKQISKLIRDNLKKVQASIQGDSVRISAKSKDDLQEAIQLVKQEDWPVALQFTNYR
ncbi:YajQ family cyclic di-GMP-binding protein [Pseudanabaena sp. FACHB-2040]|uniref:YajQ family cyclic di-GMP-binding protein n=1 Tax=Pseudanabaena sp. FACHB-2040 TaxID=2692859 RepID=UPI0016894F75|nr:YajQ family cyclic di-GMP-binding protein [Pseudanabaena sp. FACHB-2040]MBD0268383.1 YajQ family cyclic di-GMP-binding protein [Cyanobacteria bacterium Co-bin8]MBD2260072.1 YajQ family cyclic di-GMP-binding protein [Pseudanabaena sp. FACHB-2040]